MNPVWQCWVPPGSESLSCLASVRVQTLQPAMRSSWCWQDVNKRRKLAGGGDEVSPFGFPDPQSNRKSHQTSPCKCERGNLTVNLQSPSNRAVLLEVPLPGHFWGRFSPDCFVPGSTYICAACVFLEAGGLGGVLHMNEIPGTAYRHRELVKEFLENDPALLHSAAFVRRGKVPKALHSKRWCNPTELQNHRSAWQLGILPSSAHRNRFVSSQQSFISFRSDFSGLVPVSKETSSASDGVQTAFQTDVQRLFILHELE